MAGQQDVRAGKAFVELVVRDKLAAGLTKAAAKLQSYSRMFAVAGGAMVTGALGAVGGLVAVASRFGATGAAIDDMAQRTGMSAEALSELQYAAGQSGTSLESLEKGARGMARQITAAADGSESARDAFASMGLSWESLVAMNPDQQFEAIADGLAGISDPTRRAAVAMDVLGKSGADLLPMLADGAMGLQAMRDEARKLGLTISGETAAKAAKLDDALDSLKTVVSDTWFEIGSGLAPVVTKLANVLKSTLVPVNSFIERNQELLAIVIPAAAGVAAVGAGLLGVAVALKGAAVVTGAFAGVLATITSPITVMSIAVGGAALAWTRFSDSGRNAVAALQNLFTPLLTTLTGTIQGIAAAITQGKWAEAGKIAGLGLKIAFQEAIEGMFGDSQIKNAIFKIAELFGGGKWSEIGTLAWQGLSEALTLGMETIKANWDTWLQGLSDKLYEQMGKVWTWWNDKVQAMTTTLLEKAGLVTPANQMQAENDKQRLEEIERLKKRIAEWEAEAAGTTNKSMRAEQQETIDNMKTRLKGLQLVEAERQKNGMAGPAGLDIPEPRRPRADTSVADREVDRAAAQAGADAARKRLQDLFGMGQTSEQQAGIDAARKTELENMRKEWNAMLADFKKPGIVDQGKDAKDLGKELEDKGKEGIGELQKAGSGPKSAGTFSGWSLGAQFGGGNVPQQHLAEAKRQTRILQRQQEEFAMLEQKMAGLKRTYGA